MALCPICKKTFESRITRKYNYAKNRILYCSTECFRKARLKNNGYIRVWDKNRRSWIPEHRLIFERYLGRQLDKIEIIHHRNGDKENNQIENLQLFCKNNHCPGIETKHSEDIYRLLLKNKKLKEEIKIHWPIRNYKLSKDDELRLLRSEYIAIGDRLRKLERQK